MAGEMAELTEQEQNIFNAEWDKFITVHFPEREFMDIFEDNKQQVIDALKIAKFQLELEFGGINAASNQIGWTMIQPNFVLATTTPAYSTSTWMKNWDSSNVTTIWNDLWGSSTTYKQVSKYATMLLLGFYDPVDLPKVSAIKANIKDTEYPIWWIDHAIRSGVHIWELPQPIVIEKEQTYYFQAKIARPGDDELQPFGVYFGRGDHLRNKSAYAQV